MFLSPIFIGLIAAAVSWLFLAFRANAADVTLDETVVQVSNDLQVGTATTTNIFANIWNFLTFGEKSIPVYSLLCIFASVFVLVAIFNEFYRGAKLRAKRQTTNFLKGLWLLILRNKRRYGGYIIHIGIVIVYIGIMGSKGYFQLESKSLQLEDSMTVGEYRFTLLDTYQENHGNYDRFGLIFDVEKDGKHVTTMKPARHYYFTTGQGDDNTIESAIHSIGMNDLYIALGDIPPNIRNGGYVNVQIYHNPLIKLVWIGIAAMVIGGLVAIAEKQEYKPRPSTI